MPIVMLNDDIYALPNPLFGEDGIVAIGGDLNPKRLIHAYKNGIFPWYGQEGPILWHAPDPRFVITKERFHLPRSAREFITKSQWNVRINTSFEKVIQHCASIPRKGQEGTWIHPEMIEAYCQLHAMGYAVSVEVWENDNLIGGLYGIAMGPIFFGESMFYLKSGASKVALHHLCTQMDFELIDVQIPTTLMENFGAYPIQLAEFLDILQKHLNR